MARNSKISTNALRDIAAQREITLPEARLANLAEQFEDYDEVILTLNDFPIPSIADNREYWRPDDNRYGAFLVRCNIEQNDSGLLEDVSVAIKDNIAVGGVPMTCGSPALEDYVPEIDATVVSRLLSEGANIVGKTNMNEFARGGREETFRFQRPENPYASERRPGGSSTGSGIAVATGTADAALGSDTGGSVRFPAAWLGIVGVKPTRGLVSHHGLVQLSKTLDAIGTMSRTTPASARLLETIAGEDQRDAATYGNESSAYTEGVSRSKEDNLSDITIGLPSSLFGSQTDSEVAVREALDVLATDGATLREVSIDPFEYAVPAWFAIELTEMAAYFDANAVNYWASSEPIRSLSARINESLGTDEIGEYVEDSLLYGNHLIETYENEYYIRAQHARRKFTDVINSIFSSVDVLAMPTATRLPPYWDDESGEIYEVVKYTAPFNLSGHPAISVPWKLIDGLPVSVQFAGPNFTEKQLFRVARRCEMLRGEWEETMCET